MKNYLSKTVISITISIGKIKKKELAILLCKLINLKIFKDRLDNNHKDSGSPYYKTLRLFFQKRYGKEFEKEFQTNRRTKYTIDYEYLFLEP